MVKILKFFDVDSGSRMGKIRIRESGMEKSRIRDKHPGSATPFMGFQFKYYFLSLDSSYWRPQQGFLVQRHSKPDVSAAVKPQLRSGSTKLYKKATPAGFSFLCFFCTVKLVGKLENLPAETK